MCSYFLLHFFKNALKFFTNKSASILCFFFSCFLSGGNNVTGPFKRHILRSPESKHHFLCDWVRSVLTAKQITVRTKIDHFIQMNLFYLDEGSLRIFVAKHLSNVFEFFFVAIYTLFCRLHASHCVKNVFILRN